MLYVGIAIILLGVIGLWRPIIGILKKTDEIPSKKRILIFLVVLIAGIIIVVVTPSPSDIDVLREQVDIFAD
jgi:hypothetical protein